MNSQEYWRKRELENIAKDKLSDKLLLKEVQKIYNNQLYEITKEIDSFYHRYGGALGLSYAEVQKAVAEFDVKAFESTAAKMVKERDFSEEANKQLKLYNATMRINRLELLRSKIGYYMTAMADEDIKYTRDYVTKLIEDTYRRQAGILGDSVDIDVWKRAQEIVNGSFFGADFSHRIWVNMNVLYSQLNELLQKYLINGKGSIELARELKKVFATATNYERERLMRTEIRRLQTETQIEVMMENGIEQYRFIAEPTACDICKPLDDKVFDLGKLQVGTNASPMHPNCKCSITPYVDREEFEADLERRGLQ